MNTIQPTQAQKKKDKTMMNEHVYKYYRWLGWSLGNAGRPMASFFNYDFARQERELQLNTGNEIYNKLEARQ